MSENAANRLRKKRIRDEYLSVIGFFQAGIDDSITAFLPGMSVMFLMQAYGLGGLGSLKTLKIHLSQRRRTRREKPKDVNIFLPFSANSAPLRDKLVFISKSAVQKTDIAARSATNLYTQFYEYRE